MKHKESLIQYRSLTAKDIYAKITENRKRLSQLQQEKILGKLKNYREIKTLRKECARLLTIMDEKITESITTQK